MGQLHGKIRGAWHICNYLIYSKKKQLPATEGNRESGRWRRGQSMALKASGSLLQESHDAFEKVFGLKILALIDRFGL